MYVRKEVLKRFARDVTSSQDGRTPDDLDLKPTITSIIDHWRERRALAAEEQQAAEGEEEARGDSHTGSDSWSGSHGEDQEGELSSYLLCLKVELSVALLLLASELSRKDVLLFGSGLRLPSTPTLC